MPQGPFAPLVSDGSLLFIGGENRIMAFDLHTGKVIWQQENAPGDGVERLYVSNDLLLAQTGTQLIARQAATGKPLWHRDSQVKSLFIDAATRTLFTISIDVPDPSQSNSNLWSGLRAVDLASGTTRWEVATTVGLSDVSTITSTVLYLASENTITCWDLTGKQRWQQPSVGQPITSLLQTQGEVLITTARGTLIALQDTTGQPRWQISPFSGLEYGIQVVGPLIWISDTANGTVAAYTLQGTRQWMLHVGAFADLLVES